MVEFLVPSLSSGEAAASALVAILDVLLRHVSGSKVTTFQLCVINAVTMVIGESVNTEHQQSRKDKTESARISMIYLHRT